MNVLLVVKQENINSVTNLLRKADEMGFTWADGKRPLYHLYGYLTVFNYDGGDWLIDKSKYICLDFIGKELTYCTNRFTLQMFVPKDTKVIAMTDDQALEYLSKEYYIVNGGDKI